MSYTTNNPNVNNPNNVEVLKQVLFVAKLILHVFYSRRDHLCKKYLLLQISDQIFSQAEWVSRLK